MAFPIPTYEKDCDDITADDCYFYGVLLGDGSLEHNKTYGKITLHTENKCYIKDWLIQYFVGKCINYKVTQDGNTTKVRWNKTTVLPIKYGDVYDRTKTKHVHPKWLHLPLHKVKMIVKGLMDTDGSYGKELMFDSTSRNLIESLRYMCLRMGVLTSGYVRDRRGQTHVTKKGYSITNKKISYCLRLPKVACICDLLGVPEGQFQKYFEHDGMLYTRIKDIKEIHHEGTVYDLQMVEDHTYITHNALIHNGGGKRKGAFAVFIEPWHADVEDVIKLKLNHGEEHSRARDLFFAIWIPDKFMRAVQNDENWYLFCPTSVPTLQDSYGETFDALYDDAVEKELYVKTLKARELWSLITKTQIETGGPYVMYKDSVNTKSNQQNLGTIRSSNLCAEICEYSSKDEVAVCTLASICLPRFINRDGFNFKKLQKCAYLICKNLNKVIDKTSYPLKEAEYSNRKNRPMGIGVQGLADVFHQLHMAYDSTEAMEMNERIFETIYYGAMTCSIDLAEKNAPYASFEGSPLSNGEFQFDLWNVTPKYFDWDTLRERVKEHGAVNSLLIALMPTASSAQINGNTEGMEPVTSNLYVRRVLSGEFMVLNKNLEMACRKLGLWNEELVNQIIKDRGSVQQTDLPEDMKQVYKTVWEISNKWIIDHAAKRAPFVCQSQSMNLYLENANEGTISSMQFYAWKQGLKTGQYYLRTRAKANAVQFSCESCSA